MSRWQKARWGLQGTPGNFDWRERGREARIRSVFCCVCISWHIFDVIKDSDYQKTRQFGLMGQQWEYICVRRVGVAKGAEGMLRGTVTPSASPQYPALLTHPPRGRCQKSVGAKWNESRQSVFNFLQLAPGPTRFSLHVFCVAVRFAIIFPYQKWNRFSSHLAAFF